MSVSLTWVDAFTDTPFAGNPAGVCLLDESLPVSTMQSLAAELGIAETAFVTPSARPGTFDLRWFSPLVEIDLCGHATLASAHALRSHGVIDGATPVTFDTRSGALRAAFAGDLIELDFPADSMAEAPLPEALAGEWDAGVVLGAGTTSFFAVVVLRSESAVRQYRDPGSGADYVLRVFGPNVGIDEDPATGSAQCVAGPYWSTVLGRRELVARQLSPRGAVLYVRPDGDRVHIGGNAITVFTGDLCLG
jgi:predicted PhzF superfamily epimerase YddE/YHI9